VIGRLERCLAGLLENASKASTGGGVGATRGTTESECGSGHVSAPPKLTQLLSDVTDGVEFSSSSSQAMLPSLKDGTTESFWESSRQDQQRWVEVTEAAGLAIETVAIFIDNSRDNANQVQKEDRLCLCGHACSRARTATCHAHSTAQWPITLTSSSQFLFLQKHARWHARRSLWCTQALTASSRPSRRSPSRAQTERWRQQPRCVLCAPACAVRLSAPCP